MCIVLPETINILMKCAPPKKVLGCPRELYYRFTCMYIAFSSERSLLTLKMPSTVIQRRFKVVFWWFKGGLRLFSDVLEWECCTFQAIDENSFQPPILDYSFKYRSDDIHTFDTEVTDVMSKTEVSLFDRALWLYILRQPTI